MAVEDVVYIRCALTLKLSLSMLIIIAILIELESLLKINKPFNFVCSELNKCIMRMITENQSNNQSKIMSLFLSTIRELRPL